jgi:cyclopropane fatty-acyl-phospholipid synthase-like methyltransferase
MITRGQFKINFEELWQEGMKDWHGNMPERMLDDSLEEKYWKESIARKTVGQTDPYAELIFAQIKTHVAPTDTVLEIGSGWGNYTFPLVMHSHHVTCVDSSASVLRYLQQCCDKMGHNNTTFIHEKWEMYEDAALHDVVCGAWCKLLLPYA